MGQTMGQFMPVNRSFACPFVVFMTGQMRNKKSEANETQLFTVKLLYSHHICAMWVMYTSYLGIKSLRQLVKGQCGRRLGRQYLVINTTVNGPVHAAPLSAHLSRRKHDDRTCKWPVDHHKLTCRSSALSFPGVRSPQMELSFPWHFCSMEHLLLGTFVPRERTFQELSFPGTFVPSERIGYSKNFRSKHQKTI